MRGRFIPQLIFFLIALIITLIWFKQGLMYGGAEVGLLTYNPHRSLEIQQFIWWASSAPGMLVPHYISGVPFYFLLSLLQTIFSPVNLQAMIFFMLLFLMGFGMYRFSLSIIGEQKKIYAILGGLFYMFNSYVLVAIWHRFLYSHFFLAAFLPILLFFWRQWINKGKFLFLVLFLLTSLASSYMLGSLALIIAVWLSLLLISVVDIFPGEGKKEFTGKVWRFTTGSFFWLVTNIWWLIPFFTVSTGVLSAQHTSEDNINTLVSLSNQTALYYLLQFANPFYLFYTSELGTIYNSLFFKILPWIPIIVIFAGLIVSLKRKAIAGFAIIYILIVFLSKGAADPLGYPFIWAFKNIYALGVIRNPFEKLGIMLPLFGSIFFIFGLEFIFTQLKKKFGPVNALFVNIIVLFSVFIFAWPMFFGTVLKKPVEEVLVQVPSYYKQTNDWLQSQKDKRGNILHLPYSGRDVVTYNWDFGYHGVDINEMLFSNYPSITRNLGIKIVDQTLSSLTYLFSEPFIGDQTQLIKLLRNLDVNFIILHKDVEWNDISTYGKNIKFTNITNLESTLDSLDFLEKKGKIGKLAIYKLKDDYYSPKIILSESAYLIYPGEESYLYITSLLANTDEIITPLPTHSSDLPLEYIKNISVFPENYLDYYVASAGAQEKMANDILVKPDQSDSLISKLQKIRKYFFQSGELISEELITKIIESTENLTKLQNDKLLNKGSTSKLSDYNDSLKEVFKNNFKSLSLLKLYRSHITNTFYLHLYILDQLEKIDFNEQDKILELRKYLVNKLQENELLPLKISPDQALNQEIDKKVFRFKVPLKSKYELLMATSGNLDLYTDLLSNLDVSINNRLIDQKDKKDENIFTFGEFDFDQGTYEISYNSILSENLVPSLDNFLKSGNVEFIDKETAHLTSGVQGLAYLESPIKGVTGKDIYKITFDAVSRVGNEFYVELIQDIEEFDSNNEYQAVQSGECGKHICYSVLLDVGLEQMKTYTLYTSPLNIGSQRTNIRINVFPNLQGASSVEGDVYIRNFQVNKVFDGKIILRKSVAGNIDDSHQGELVGFYRQSPTSYFGKIKLSKPIFLFFKETFHSGWKLKLSQNDKVFEIDNHYLGNLYSNAYFIDRVGEYNFSLEFEPQKNADKGLIISLIGWVVILIIFLRSEFKRII